MDGWIGGGEVGGLPGGTWERKKGRRGVGGLQRVGKGETASHLASIRDLSGLGMEEEEEEEMEEAMRVGGPALCRSERPVPSSSKRESACMTE